MERFTFTSLFFIATVVDVVVVTAAAVSSDIADEVALSVALSATDVDDSLIGSLMTPCTMVFIATP
ncbi:hypothetical protein [Undibacterium sp. RuTC16W]|uniref:hypothetical protein n=1 Tax=Undibacterium sp. RuTC16W TaxID=3413048 RepID=UPI003BEF695D